MPVQGWYAFWVSPVMFCLFRLMTYVPSSYCA